MIHLLMGAAKTAKSVQNFVEGGELLNVLSTFGDIEYTAAGEAMADLARARDPQSQLWSAINHLQSAHVAYRNVYSQGGIKAYLGKGTSVAAANKDVFTLCLMAICYRYLGEEALTRHALERAAAPMKEWADWSYETSLGELASDPEARARTAKALLQGIAGWFNAGNWVVAKKLDETPLPDITGEQFAAFSRLMLTADVAVVPGGGPGRPAPRVAAKCRGCGRRRKLSAAGLCRECG